MKTLDKLVLKEFVLLSLASFGLFMAAFTAVDSVSSSTRQIARVGLVEFLEFLFLRGLTFQPFVLPIALLLATLLCFSRMVREGEVLGLEACGISRRRIVAPVLVCLGLMSMGSFCLNEAIAKPASQRCARLIARVEKGGDLTFKGLSTGPEIMPDGRERLFIAHSMDLGKHTLNGVFLHFFMEGRRVEEVYAQSASWQGDQWRLEEVRKLTFNGTQERASETRFKEILTASDLFGAFPGTERLLSSRAELQSFGSLRRQLTSLPRGGEGLTRERNKLLLEMHGRVALAASSLIFGMLALPFAFSGAQRGFGGSLGATVGLAVVYYIVLTFTNSLCEAGQVGPFFGAWTANIAFGLVALRSFLRDL